MRLDAAALLLAALALAGAEHAHAHQAHVATPTAATDGAAAAITGEPLPYAGAGRFTLVDHTGVIRTEADFPGRYRLVYFGYTYCLDACPTGLQMMSDAMDIWGDRA